MMHWNKVGLVKNGRPLLQDISVDLLPGQLTVILGPNGAGKSTFLKLCSREMEPSSGAISLHGMDLRSWPTEELAMIRGVLSQSHPMAFPMDVAELVMMGRYPHRHRQALDSDDHTIVQGAMQECSVDHLQGRSTQFLSGGEMQRVQTARVLAQIWNRHPHHERLLLLDEPTASLDPAFQHLCLLKAQRMAEQGVCVVAILHDLNLAARYADRIVFLKEGRLVASGPMQDMMDEALLQQVFAVEIRKIHDPRLAHPLIVTLGPGHQHSTKEPKLRSL